MAPNEEAQQADCEYGVNHHPVTEYRFARKRRQDLRGQTHSGDYGDVDLGVTEEPEQMLPQDRRAARMISYQLAVDDLVSGNEEASPSQVLKQQQDSAG